MCLEFQFLVHIWNQLCTIGFSIYVHQHPIHSYLDILLLVCFISYRTVSALIVVTEDKTNKSICRRILLFMACLIVEYHYFEIIHIQIYVFGTTSTTMLVKRLFFLESTILCFIQAIICFIYLLQLDNNAMIVTTLIGSLMIMLIDACHHTQEPDDLGECLCVLHIFDIFNKTFIFALLCHSNGFVSLIALIVSRLIIFGVQSFNICNNLHHRDMNVLFGIISIFNTPAKHLLKSNRTFIVFAIMDLLTMFVSMVLITSSITAEKGNKLMLGLYIVSWIMLVLQMECYYKVSKKLSSNGHATVNNRYPHKNQSLSEIFDELRDSNEYNAYNVMKYEHIYFNGRRASGELQNDYEISHQLVGDNRENKGIKKVLITGLHHFRQTYDHFDACKVFQALTDSGDSDGYYIRYNSDIDKYDMNAFQNKVLLISGYINTEIRAAIDRYVPIDIMEMIATFYKYGLICCDINTLPVQQERVDVRGNLVEFVHMNKEMLTKGILDDFVDAFEIIVFCVPLPTFCGYELENEYDSNQMRQAMDYYQYIVNHQALVEIPIIVLFTNKSEFMESIKHESLNQHFNQYNGDPRSYDETTEFIKEKFESITHNPGRYRIFSHFIDGKNSDDLRYEVFNDLQDEVVNNSLTNGGLI